MHGFGGGGGREGVPRWRCTRDFSPDLVSGAGPPPDSWCLGVRGPWGEPEVGQDPEGPDRLSDRLVDLLGQAQVRCTDRDRRTSIETKLQTEAKGSAMHADASLGLDRKRFH